jgi:hypothetical protein
MTPAPHRATRRSVALAILLIVLLALIQPRLGTYRGRVIDADSGRPITGAVIALLWCKSPLVGMDRVEQFHAAKEVATNSDGRFAVTMMYPIDWNPFTSVRQPPDLAIVAAGYQPINAIARRSLRGELSKGDGDIALRPVSPQAPRCGTIDRPCTNGTGLFAGCGPWTGKLPLVESAIRAEREK